MYILSTRKKKSAFAAIQGAIPGALPILMGYAASAGVIDGAGFYLFIFLFFWQMPHFWCLAIKLKEEYAKANIPTLPVSLGIFKSKAHIQLWLFGYVGVLLCAPFFFQISKWTIFFILFMSSFLLFENFRYQKSTSSWIRFFLIVNFSLILFLFILVFDRWFIPLFPNLFIE